ncbi:MULTISPECIES: hypothetical protein [unclassified Rathayibacter]|uniref:hypothetical protein n=1 Tax=unclassified Rathayibacter TaxID=2609250 RepID=UPI00188B4416|nr:MULTISPECIES: hypothetical protein [unclassified Rathayibacter]MBF4463382.1 hypothetical protein [Rathayibacter sp. VKM Ac-2879]MBF4504895.1 hypothetical protein [Rathayibacter sp. VKM Ac-2878]
MAVLLLAGGSLLAAGTGSANRTSAAASVPVDLDCAGAPSALTLGVVASLSSAPGEGAEWKDAANGAVVAAQRFALGGCTVRLVAADDHGTAEGARSALTDLADSGVAGVVLATSGPHLSAAIDAARSNGLAAILPYPQDATSIGDDAWLIAPDRARIDTALASLGTPSTSPTRLLLVNGGGDAPEGLDAEAELRFAPGDPAGAFIDSVRSHLTGDAPAERVLVSGPAEQQGAAVGALQSAGASLPLLLTPDARSPAFAPALLAAGGTLSGEMSTVGVESGDAVALRGDEAGLAMSAFLAGVRIAAGDARRTALFDDRPFADVAASADAPSHDAVVALVRAAARAGSGEPSAVTAALRGSTMGTAEGLAGPPLDFGRRSALSAALVPLHATAHDLGLRPRTAATPLLWFAEQPRP